MSQIEKIINQILEGRSDKNFKFKNLLLNLGFDERIRGSHHLFRKKGIEEKINIQKDGAKTKAYQIKQIRKIILKYKLG